jgi:hypothetical protein
MIGLLLTLAVAAEPAPAPEVFLHTGFEDNLDGWQQHGPAEFVLDTADVHSGAKALRLTIAPGADLHWQQLDFRVPGIVRGDQLRATVWVRTHGLTDGSGAYACIEFLDGTGARCGIEHSLLGLGNGSHGWQQLVMEAEAPLGTASASFNLILNSHGSAWFDDAEFERTGHRLPWPDKGGAVRHVTVSDRVTQPHFAGVGFHVFGHIFPATQRELDEVIWKRWREVDPSFARMNDDPKWDQPMREQVARWLGEFKRSGTEIYFATWGPEQTKPGAERLAYVKKMVDQLEYFYRTRGLTNVRWYCMSNELSLSHWGSLRDDMETFADYQRQFHQELARRGLPIGMLATDASPASWWDTLDWAATHMDDITEIYGGHHYFTEHTPEDERFYDWFTPKLQGAVDLARSKGKDFLLGEFGCRQDGRTVDGTKRDVCVWFDTPSEPYVALQLADAVIGSLNTGVYALANWTFMDLPDSFVKGYLNKWGTFKRGESANGPDWMTRPHYYGYGLLARWCRGPAAARAVTTDDPWLRAAALSAEDGATIVVLNRFQGEVPVRIALGTLPSKQPWRKYLCDPKRVPINAFGDLQPPAGKIVARDGVLEDRLGANCLVVYTTRYVERVPPAVKMGVALTSGPGLTITWRATEDLDQCYYRVYRGGAQIGSTLATSFSDEESGPSTAYRVAAVDRWGNESPH